MPGGSATKPSITGADTGSDGVGAGTTVTVTDSVTLPLSFVAVKIYVVVVEGELVALPEAGTEPPPGDIETDVAPATSQSRVELSPSFIVAGLAVNDAITGAEAGEPEAAESHGVESEGVEPAGVESGGEEVPATVTVTCFVVLPALLVAVMV